MVKYSYNAILRYVIVLYTREKKKKKKNLSIKLPTKLISAL